MPKSDEQALIAAALALADSLEWDISDSGHAGVKCNYNLAGELFDAATAWREANGQNVPDEAKRQQAFRGLASLVRR